MSAAVVSIEIASITVAARMRPLDPLAMDALAGALADVGLMHPIGVSLAGKRGSSNEHYVLVWGLHRLRAAQRLGWTHIDARVLTAGAGNPREFEALENLSRADLSPYDRAAAVHGLRVAALVDAGLSPDLKDNDLQAEALKANKAAVTVKFTVTAIAARVGRSVASVTKDLALYELLLPGLAEAMRPRDGWANASVVQAFAKFPRGIQSRLISRLQSAPADLTLKDILKELDDSEVLSDTERAEVAFLNGWNRLSLSAKQRFALELVDVLTAAQRADLIKRLQAPALQSEGHE